MITLGDRVLHLLVLLVLGVSHMVAHAVVMPPVNVLGTGGHLGMVALPLLAYGAVTSTKSETTLACLERVAGAQRRFDVLRWAPRDDRGRCGSRWCTAVGNYP